MDRGDRCRLGHFLSDLGRLRPVIAQDAGFDKLIESLWGQSLLVACLEVCGPSTVFFPVAGVLKDRDSHLAGAVRFEDVYVEMRDGTRIVPHITFASMEETARVAEVLFCPFGREAERDPFTCRHVTQEASMKFRHNENVEFELRPHEPFVHMPDHHPFVFPDDLVQLRVGIAEGADLVFKVLPHAVVLLVRPAAFEAEEFFFGQGVCVGVIARYVNRHRRLHLIAIMAGCSLALQYNHFQYSQ